MKLPDLSTAADAGVHDWTGAPETLKTAATDVPVDPAVHRG
jgi:hypothetical protein